jgi:hypothetical protein
MAVQVDKSRANNQSAGVNHALRCRIGQATHGGNLPILNCD